MRADVGSHGLLWVALGAALWGTDTLFRRPLTLTLPSARIVLLEHLVLSAVLLPVFWRTRREWAALSARGWAAVLGIAWGGSALGTLLFTEAVRAGNPTTAVLLQKTQPLFAALLASACLGEILGRRFWAVLGVAVCGAYLVSFGARLPAWGVEGRAAVLALSAAVCWGASTVLGRFVLYRVSWPALTALRILAATPVLLAPAWLSRAPSAPLDARMASGILMLALVPGLAALLAYYRGLEHCRASRAAVAELAFPATAALLNWMYLGARISAPQAAGFALIWLAIVNLESTRA